MGLAAGPAMEASSAPEPLASRGSALTPGGGRPAGRRAGFPHSSGKAWVKRWNVLRDQTKLEHSQPVEGSIVSPAGVGPDARRPESRQQSVIGSGGPTHSEFEHRWRFEPPLG